MTTRPLPYLVPGAVLALGIGLLQAHSLAFWMRETGPVAGAATSVLLEIVGLWLWFRQVEDREKRAFWRAIAFCASLLLLAGPMYEVSAPLLREGTSTAALDAEIVRQTELSETYQAIARTRLGWQSKIDAAEAKLSALLAQRWGFAGGPHVKTGVETGAETAPRLPWQRRAIIALNLAALLIFWAAIILAITTVSERYHEAPAGVETAPETPPGLDSAPDQQIPMPKNAHSAPLAAPELESRPEAVLPAAEAAAPLLSAQDDGPPVGAQDAVSLLVATLQAIVLERVRTGKSQAQVARESGLTPKGLSFLLNHFERRERGDQVLGLQALTKISERLRPAIDEATGAPPPQP